MGGRLDRKRVNNRVFHVEESIYNVRDKQMMKTLGPSTEQNDVIKCFSLFKVVSVFYAENDYSNQDPSSE